MSEEAKKAERLKELEAKKAMLEAYRQKRRLDKSLPEAKEGAAPVAVAAADQVLASVLAGAQLPPAPPAVDVEEKKPEAPATGGGAGGGVEIKAENVTTEAIKPVKDTVLVRGVGVQEAAPRLRESYVRLVQTEVSQLTGPEKKAEVAAAPEERSEAPDPEREERRRQQEAEEARQRAAEEERRKAGKRRSGVLRKPCSVQPTGLQRSGRGGRRRRCGCGETQDLWHGPKGPERQPNEDCEPKRQPDGTSSSRPH